MAFALVLSRAYRQTIILACQQGRSASLLLRVSGLEGSIRHKAS